MFSQRLIVHYIPIIEAATIDLEGIMPSEIKPKGERENMAWYLLYAKPKKKKRGCGQTQ